MAIFKTVNSKTKSHAGMRNCLEYVLKETKTKDGFTYLTGPGSVDDITWDSTYQLFLEEKKIWDKDSGRMYAHNVISFHKDEDITDEQAFEFGKEFAQGWFDGFQTLVAVHQDKDHVHIHLVTNSVSYEDGRKLHQTKKDLQKAKDYVNDMCRQRGLTIAEKGKHFDGSDIEKGEVTSWDKNTYNMLKDDSKKSFLIDCLAAFLNAISQAFDVESFIRAMKENGWDVLWKDSRKNITFVDTDGNKVRDSKLSKTFNVEISKEAIIDECNRKNKESELVAGSKSTGRKSATEVPELIKADRRVEEPIRDTKKRKRSIGEAIKEYSEQVRQRDAERHRLEIENEERKKKSQDRDR